MKKKQGIFLVIFCLLLAIMSGTVLSLYDNVREHSKVSKEDITLHYCDEFGYYALALQKAMNPDYKVLSYGKEVPEYMQNICDEYINDVLKNSLTVIQSDSDFMFQAVDTKTNKELSHHKENMEKTDKLFQFTIQFHADSSIQMKGDLDDRIFNQSIFESIANNVLDYYRDRYMDLYSVEDVENGFDYHGVHYGDESIKVNIPKNLSVSFALPQEVTKSSHYYGNVYYESYAYAFAATAMAVCCGILFMYFLIYPVRVVENAPLFKRIYHLKAGLRVLLMAFLISIWITSTIMLSVFTINK